MSRFVNRRQLLCLVFMHSYPVEFVSNGFEIMDMKKCAAIPLNMHVKDLPWFNYWFSFTLAYSRISHEYSSLFIIVITLIFMFSL